MSEAKNEKKLNFVKDAIYNGVLVHKMGEVKTLDNSLLMADRWIKRGIAIEVQEEKVDLKAAAKAEKEAKDKIEAEAKAKLEADKKAQGSATIANGAAPANTKEKDL